MPINKPPDSGWRGAPAAADGTRGVLVLREKDIRGDALEVALDEARGALLRGVPIKVSIQGVKRFDETIARCIVMPLYEAVALPRIEVDHILQFEVENEAQYEILKAAINQAITRIAGGEANALRMMTGAYGIMVH
jgi:hypothetical protein